MRAFRSGGTDGQTLDAQVAELRAAGATQRRLLKTIRVRCARETCTALPAFGTSPIVRSRLGGVKQAFLWMLIHTKERQYEGRREPH